MSDSPDAIFFSKRISLVTAIQAITGALSIIVFLSSRSEQGSGFLFGYSLPRLLIAFTAFVIVLGLLGITFSEIKQIPGWLRLKQNLQVLFLNPWRVFILFALLFTFFLCIVAVLILAISPASKELVILQTILNNMGLLLIWFDFIVLGIFYLILIYLRITHRLKSILSPLQLAILFAIFTVIYFLTAKFYAKITWDLRMRNLEDFIFLPVLLFLSWGLLEQFFKEKTWSSVARRVLFLLAIGVVTYTIYRHTSQWMAWTNTPSKAYWHELAEAFMQGRLFLTNPDSQHDLTFFNGNWYVPNPPLPAFIIMPLVAIYGAAKTNTVLFSITIGAINAILVYLILEKASNLEMIPTKKSANLLITALFVFGTSHMWLAIMGRMWFISQLLTLTFAALALLFVLKRFSPWWIGLCLGLAVMSRPNIFTLWPLLAGIAFYFMYQTSGKVEWGNWFKWSFQSAVPVCLGVAGLLFYNFIRFGNIFDFGYVSINSSDWMMEAVQTYGMFNIHFLATNFNMMFLRIPQVSLTEGCLYYSATRDGVSVLSMTPALIYVVRRLKFNLWTIGAWISTFLTIILLLLYSNNGAWQLGYRYLMDFILPLLLLLAIGIGNRKSAIFVTLVVISIVSFFLGTIWWFNMWWC
ncbi:MAG: hypothetical protein CVU46_03495 [Chloroflexi bacterium HGW-Chloroflexi-8]|nr:MAG: hypothetical protein CVU46_03495 [Chloroflexi bacterium HGW-Chloroflexi-8]